MTVEELREELFVKIAGFRSFDTLQIVDSLIAAARAEGAEQERERLRELVTLDEDEFGDLTVCWLPLSAFSPKKTPVLSPAPKETTLDKAGVTLRGQHGVDW